MATIKEIIERVDENKPNAFTEKTKLRWLAALDGKVAVDVFLLDIVEAKRMAYTHPEDLETELLVGFPHEDIYDLWLKAQIDFENGEYDKYQNTMEMFNTHYSNFVRWFADTYEPSQGGICGFRHSRYYISAYGLAVKHGFEGTEEEWLKSLVGGFTFGAPMPGPINMGGLRIMEVGLPLADGDAVSKKYVDARTLLAEDPNNDGNIVLRYGNVDSGGSGDGGGGSGGSGGAPGADVFSPIATVVPTEDGALITITDKNGTTEVAVSNGKDGAKGDKGDTGIAVTGATVGQTVKISTVDDSGIPTAWEAVDFPGGGGGNLEFIGSFAVESGVSNVVFNLNGNYSRIFIADENPSGAALTSGEFTVSINGLKNQHKVGKSNKATSGFNYSIMTIEAVKNDSDMTFANFTITSGGANGATASALSGTNAPDSLYKLYPIQKVIFTAITTDATFNSKKYSFWGVKS